MWLASDMVSDQAVPHQSAPHEGRCQPKLAPPIVGLMRNSLSEASTHIVCFYFESRTLKI